jgi:hypothetical protein
MIEESGEFGANKGHLLLANGAVLHWQKYLGEGPSLLPNGEIFFDFYTNAPSSVAFKLIFDDDNCIDFSVPPHNFEAVVAFLMRLAVDDSLSTMKDTAKDKLVAVDFDNYFKDSLPKVPRKWAKGKACSINPTMNPYLA